MELDTIVMQDIYRYDKDGVDENGRTYGKFVATGNSPGVHAAAGGGRHSIAQSVPSANE